MRPRAKGRAPLHFLSALLLAAPVVPLLHAGEAETPPAEKPVVHMPGLFLGRADCRELLEKTEKSVKEGAGDLPALVLYAQLLFRSSRFDEARACCDRILKDHPDNPEAHVLLCLHECAFGTWDGAKPHLVQVLKTSVPTLGVFRWLPLSQGMVEPDRWKALVEKVLEVSELKPKDLENARRDYLGPESAEFEHWYSYERDDLPITLPLHFKDNQFFVRAKVDEKKTFNLLFDTGAGDLVLEKEVVKDQGIRLGVYSAYGAHGEYDSEDRRLHAIRLGEWRLRNVPISVGRMNLFGIHFFQKHGLCATVDRATEHLVIARKPPEQDNRHRRFVLPYMALHRRIFLRIKLEDEEERLFLFDTGSQRSLVDVWPFMDLFQKDLITGRQFNLKLSGVGQTKTVPAWLIKDVRLRLSDKFQIRLKESALALNLATTADFSPVLWDGVIGADIFNTGPLKKGRLTIDFKNQKLIFDVPKDE